MVSPSMKFSGGMQRELLRFYRKSPGMFIDAMRFASIRFITGMVEGQYGPKPPIKGGFLRGSFSTFVDNKYLANPLLPRPPSGKGQVRVRTTDIECKGPNAVWVSNMPYASKMENEKWTPGPRSQDDGGVGNHFLSIGLKKGAQPYGKHIASRMKYLMDTKARGI